MDWWIWISGGLLLLLSEALAPGTFYLFFLAVSAAIVGAFTALSTLTSIESQLFVFAITTVTLLLTLRPLLVRLMNPRDFRPDRSDFVGESAICLGEIAAQERGRVELRGSSWSALNIGDQPLKDKARVTVKAVEGLILHVQ
jgi:membrane protein implicated in regulation of membrane protease activity